ncbi:MAG: outer membrane protein assembly factor BamD [Candidatus Krumholzibacteriia bacterium]|nr:outer membrane protein assembly factor BamD [bacterium]MCB9515029.1 outer membrane protein assembly factor BamD [Candidatus Latescibacterota bacterium]
MKRSARDPKALRRQGLVLLALLLVGAALAGCSSSRGLSRKGRADNAFARGDYASAIQDYQVFLEEAGLGVEAMDAHFMLARSYFENGDYPTAAVEFEIFQRDYPRSDSLLAAAWYQTLCWVEQSPAYDRDATPTLKAIQMLQDFLLDHPDAPQAPDAKVKLAALQDKLAHKALSVAELYRRMERPQAAAIYYEKLLREYPDSPRADAAVLGLIAVRVEMGERGEARRLAERVAADRPDSELARRARALLDR